MDTQPLVSRHAPSSAFCSYFCGVRASVIWTLFICVATQTALRSVPSLVFNDEYGMAAELNYTNTHRGAILSGFGWAYTAAQIPGGYMSQVIGPKKTLGLSVALGATAGILMPTGASFSPVLGPLVLNAVIGLSQGPVFPVVKGVMAKWLRPEEMARGNAFVVSASWNGGQVLQFLLSPRLLKSRGFKVPLGSSRHIQIPGGWRLAWYVYSPLGLLWCFLWMRVGADSPRLHPRVRPETLEFLERGRVTAAAATEKGATKSGSESESGFGLKVMWRVCQARPVYLSTLCLALDGAGQAYANWLPQYYSTQLDYNIVDTGLVVALPLFVGMTSSLLGGVLADAILARGVSVTTVRRCFNLVPTLLMVGCTLGMTLRVAEGTSRRDQLVAVGLQITISGLNGFKQAGISPVAMDISTKYAAAIVGVMNCGSNFTYYALANNAIGWWLDRGRCQSTVGPDPPPISPEDEVTCRMAWSWLFIGSAGIFFVSGLIFLFVRCDPIDDMLDGASASAITPATGAPSALSRNTAQPTVAYAQMLGPTTDLKSPFVQLPYPAVSDSVISDSRSSAQQGQGSTAAVGVGGAPYPTYTPAPTITAVGGGVGPVAHIAQMDAPVTYSV